jgi:hypothetical protein
MALDELELKSSGKEIRSLLSADKENAGGLMPDPALYRLKTEFSRPYRENFLYLIRCGIVESVPRRRFLSSS